MGVILDAIANLSLNAGFADDYPFWALLFGTFVLEDVALITGLGLVAEQRMGVGSAFWAIFIGILAGDVGLYGLGRFFPRSHKRKEFNQSPIGLGSIAMSRFIPGARLAVYPLAGFYRYPWLKFVLIVTPSVLVWVGTCFYFGSVFFQLFKSHLFFGIFALLIIMIGMKRLIPLTTDRWQRQALIHSWRRWTHFEFWPPWLFYPPVALYALWLTFRHRSITAPLYCNPGVRNGGLIGESKWDFLKHISDHQDHGLESFLCQNPKEARSLIVQKNLSFPLILKPDQGQRGYGVRLIQNQIDLDQYCEDADYAVIVQEFSALPHEAGLFFVKEPYALKGRIISFTDKKLPTLIGDGNSQLGDLILRDRRARIIAPIYIKRHQALLESIPEKGAEFRLTNSGNHCQGAIFLDGRDMITPALEDALDRLAKTIPNFHVGRFDIKYKNENQLMLGLDFKVVEVNGVGSESTHIWDPQTRLWDAYQALFDQWRIIYCIGARVKKDSLQSKPFLLRTVAQDLVSFFRKNRLMSVSS